MSFQWGYGKDNGPQVWGDHWSIAKNPNYGQSPIDIETGKAMVNDEWSAPEFNYGPDRCRLFKNTGKSVQVDVASPDLNNKDDWSFRGGPMHHRYSLAQFHFHWGPNDCCGSEHTVDGTEYALECHLVHFNRDLFKSPGEAIDKPGGLMVCGMLFKAGRHHAGLQELIGRLGGISHCGDQVDLTEGYDPTCLLPQEGDRGSFWHYYGSLTTPPLYESVNWIVFKQPQEASSEQLAEFRKLHNYSRDGAPEEEFGGCILKNYRPPQEKDFITMDKNGLTKRVHRQLFSTAQ